MRLPVLYLCTAHTLAHTKLYSSGKRLVCSISIPLFPGLASEGLRGMQPRGAAQGGLETPTGPMDRDLERSGAGHIRCIRI